MIDDDVRKNLIDSLCIPINELEMRVSIQNLLKNHDIQFVAHLLTYEEKYLNGNIFSSSSKIQKELAKLYETLEEFNIKKWFDALLSEDIRGMNGNELKAHLNELPEDTFAVIISEEMREEGDRSIQERKDLENRIKALLPKELQNGLKGAFLKTVIKEVAQELSDPDSGVNDLNDLDAVRDMAKDVISNKLGLD